LRLHDLETSTVCGSQILGLAAQPLPETDVTRLTTFPLCRSPSSPRSARPRCGQPPCLRRLIADSSSSIVGKSRG